MQCKYLIFILLTTPFQVPAQNLTDTIVSLEEVTVQSSGKNVQMSAPQSIVHISTSDIQQHFS
ncbi:MAG: hypothetical protein LBR66_01840, partial [Candidatus Symbiothrix sp.]|nr:hypothetical protein [Candidatus Symbiothrix sp.]